MPGMLRIIAATLCISAIHAAAAADLADLLPLYGDQVEYHVTRNGEPAGSHRLNFSGTPAQLTVIAQTRATMSIWGLFEVPFIYDSQAVWKNGTLVSLSSFFRQTGEGQHFWLRKDNGGYLSSQGEHPAAALFPTNHWNAAVLRQDTLFNTLNGNFARVTIRPLAEETLILGKQTVTARRYEVTGDLNISLWYDEDGKWLQLQFAVLGGQYRFTYQPPADG